MAQSSLDTGTRGQASYAVPVPRRGDAARSSLSPAVYEPDDSPGCESFHLPASEIDHYEGRLEFWDGHTETAWKVCDTTIQHEAPSRRLVEMATRVSALRGSRIACFGSANLVRFDAAGRKRWLMQADEVLYLHPDRSRLQGPAIDVDEDPLPEVARRALERVALAMGARAGTRPEDDPFTRSVSEKAEVKGYARGRKEGHDEGRREMLAANVLAVLKARGIEAALDSAEDRDLFSGLSVDALMAAAMACTGEADFRQRVREQ